MTVSDSTAIPNLLHLSQLITESQDTFFSQDSAMVSNSTNTAVDQKGAGDRPEKSSEEVPETLRVDTPTDGKVPEPKQETKNGDEKANADSSKTESTKTAPVVSQPTASSKSDDVDKATKEREEREAWEENRKKLTRKAAVKWSDYEHFKNRYSPEEGLEIIEVLYGHPDLGGEISREKARRNSKRAIAGRKAPAADNRWIQRVRIESAVLIPLLAHLTSCDGVINDWPSDRPRVFFRPFATFYHTFPLIRKCVEILESIGQGVGGHGTDFDLHSPVVAANADPAEADLDMAKSTTERASIIESSSGTNVWEVLLALDPTIALQHLRVYVEFIEKNIIPMWDEAAGTSKQRARFCDLPMFFRPGELLFTTHGTSTATTTSKSAAQNRSSEKRAVQNIFKLVSVHMSEMEDTEPSDWRNAGRTLHVRAYHVDFNGDTYGPDEVLMRVAEYAGEKDIRSLYVYPLRYEKDRKKIEAELCERGKRFLPLVRERHCYYDGSSLLFNKAGDEPTDSDLNPEYIDGEIMIDFKEGSRANPDLMSSVHSVYDMGAFRWYDLTDPIEIKFWDGPSRVKLLGESRDVTQTEEDFRKQYELSMLKRDYFVKAHEESESWLKEYTTDLSSHFGKFSRFFSPSFVFSHRNHLQIGF